jgi:Glycosyl hydrolases family 16
VLFVGVPSPPPFQEHEDRLPHVKGRRRAKIRAWRIWASWFDLILIFLLSWSCLMLRADTQARVAFKDEFKGGKLDTTKWILATYKSPDSSPGVNCGIYVSSAIDFTQGMLRITVQQHATASGIESLGGAIISRELFGFGTYDFEMRMSSLSPTPQGDGTASTGAVSSGFIYYNKSESEIDLEFLGNENALWVSSWFNLDPNFDPTPLQKTSDKVDEPALATRFRHYSLVWSQKTVDVYIDGTRVAHQTEHVPQNPAHIILQHRGTNSDKWGGVAAVDVERYFFVRSVKFTPRDAK